MVPVDDEDLPVPVFGPGIGPVWRRTYEPNPKHGPFDRGSLSRGPRDGQDALDWSVPAKASSDRADGHRL